MSNRKRRLEGEVGAFLQQYARKAHRNHDPNDRRYDREVEAAVQRMAPEAFDALVHGGADDAAEAQAHAEALVAAFVAPARRGRYLALLRAGPRGRAKFRAALAHLRDLDPRYAGPVPAAEQSAPGLARFLQARGAPDLCVVVSESAARDGRVLPLADALQDTVGRGLGTFVSCLRGELAYYEGEDPGARYVLQRAVV